MFSSKISSALLALGAAQSVLGHVIMVEPHPYNLDTEPLYQVSPLSAELPFPCQGRTQNAEQVTTVTAGQMQTVKLWGAAVHGGGSCQFSVAYGDAPPATADGWHTIYSIIGGCPAEAAGNIPSVESDPAGRENGPQCGNDSGTECMREFQVPIPKDMKNGPAIFAWTWFNNLGNREMYMTCAPINVEGGLEDSSFVDTLPAIFTANIPGQCTTSDSGGIVGFPEPGAYGKVNQEPTPGIEGSCPVGVAPIFEDSAAAAPPAPESQVYSPPATVPSSAIVATPSKPPVTDLLKPESSAAPQPTKAPEGNAPKGGDEKQPDWAAGMTPCTTSGTLVCLGEGSFGICNQGWALPQQLGAGTKCVDGAIVAS